MKKEPSGHLYMHAQQFYKVAERASKGDALLGSAPYAIIVNYAFCVEMLLKACDPKLVYYNPPSNTEHEEHLVSAARIQSNISGHELSELFENLDTVTSSRIAELFIAETDEEIRPLLEKCSKYFINARYPHDTKYPSSFDIGAIRQLASGLMACMLNWNR